MCDQNCDRSFQDLFCPFFPLVAYYSSTDVANLYLAKNSPKSLYYMIIYQSQTIYPLWSNLGDAVRYDNMPNIVVDCVVTLLVQLHLDSTAP